jgi:hypothetical protein
MDFRVDREHIRFQRRTPAPETEMTFTEFFRAVWMEVQFQRTAGTDSRATFARNMSWVRRCTF